VSVTRIGLDADLAEGMDGLVSILAQNGYTGRITSTVRSYREQKFLFDRYSAGNSALPAVAPGYSAHEYGWAFDLVVGQTLDLELQMAVGSLWVKYFGGAFGGKKDPVHFELPGAGKAAWALGQQKAQEDLQNNPSLWDYAGWALSFLGLADLLFQLGYTVASRDEAVKIAKALHIDPNGRIF
jgi:hypothetical protein